MATTDAPHDQPKADDHGGIGPPKVEAVKQGYESDGYDTTSVVSVPVLVVVFFVLAFVTTSILFAYFTRSQDYSGAHHMAKERNKAPLADRIARINRATGEVDQPRLEPLRVREGDARVVTRPEVESQNPPYLHPEDVRPDPVRTPELYAKAPNEPLSEIIAKPNQALFPVQTAASLPLSSSNVPSGANAGRGAEQSSATPPVLPKVPEIKKDDKKDPQKDKEPKKDAPQPPKGPNPGEGKK